MDTFTPQEKPEGIAIIGCGQVGRSWAMLFASGNYKVHLYDNVNERAVKAKRVIKLDLEKFEKAKLLKGKGSAKYQTCAIQCHTTMKYCTKDVPFILECITENLEEKTKLYSQLESLVGKDIIIASSTSTLRPTDLAYNMLNKSRFIVTHPVNPPYFIPLVEIVPGKWTDELTVTKSKQLMVDIGQSPIVLKKEIPGFAVNRIQYLMLNECWNLVYDGVVDVEDVDKIISDGIGMKYAFIGPFENVHLKVDGVENFFERYGKAIHCISQTFKPAPKIVPNALEEFAEHYNKKMPLDKLDETRDTRNTFLRKLWDLKKQFVAAIRDKRQPSV